MSLRARDTVCVGVVITAQIKMEAFEPTIALLFTQGSDYESISLYLLGDAAGRRGILTSMRRLCSNRGMRIRHNKIQLENHQEILHG